MTRIRRNAALFLLLFCGLGGLAAGIGDAVPELEHGPMLKGERVRLADNRGKIVVLHFWKTACPPCAQAMAQINELIDKYPGRAAFLAVGVELPDQLRKEPRWKQFRCPVASDALRQLPEVFFARPPRLPADAVIGADGKLLWTGPTGELAGALGEIIDGKYDLAAAAALDRFNRDMTDAMTHRDFDRALSILRERRKAFPDDLELAIGEANILAGSCRKPEEALAVLDRALAGHPKAFPLHHAKLRILRTLDPAAARARRIAACEAVAREFRDRPALLAQLAAGMLKQPAGSFDLIGAWHLAHAAYRAAARDPREHGRAAATLARCYYYMGMADRAMLLQTEALEAFGKSREAERAARDLAFYREALSAAEEVRKLEAK